MKRLFFGVFGGFCLVLVAIGTINYVQISGIRDMQNEMVYSDRLVRSIEQHKELFQSLRQHNPAYDQAAFNRQLWISRNDKFWYTIQYKRLNLNKSLREKGYHHITNQPSDSQIELLRGKETLLLQQIANLGFKELGIIGDMRERAHYIEQAYPQYKTRLLSLRRHEKDFLMRIDRIYALKFHNEYLDWKKSGDYPPELVQYADYFQQVVNSYIKLMKPGSTESFQSWRKEFEQMQTAIYQQQSAILSAGLTETKAARQTTLLLNGTMILLAILVSLLFVEWFSRQIKNLQLTMANYIAKNYQFDEEQQLRFPKNDLGKIAVHFLKLTRKIRTDMQLLEDRVERRTVTLQSKNHQLEVQHREIMDSMRYAQNLQQSLLVSRTKLLRSFREAWVFYQPKDLVGGDFYWMKEVRKPGETCILFALADCTGHGVPGALLSVMGMNALDELIESGCTEPALLLNQLRTLVVRRLNTHEDKRYDGMDMALFAWNTTDNTLSFSGAQLPIWILRNDEVLIIKGQRLPIGYSYTPTDTFTEQSIDLLPGDRILLFSDGFVDQFGGFSGKKMGKKHLYDWLKKQVTESTLSLHYKLKELYQSWMGDSEQTDDCTYVLLEPEITAISQMSSLVTSGMNAGSKRNEKDEVSIGVVNKCG